MSHELTFELVDQTVDVNLVEHEIVLEVHHVAGVGGGSGDSVQISRPAGATLSALRLVTLNASDEFVLFDPVVGSAGRAVGVTSTAGNAGNPVTVVTSGRLDGGTWTPQAVYFAAAAGVLTTVPPTSGLRQRVGYAPDANTFIVDLGEPLGLLA